MPLPKSHRTLEPRDVCANCRHFQSGFYVCNKYPVKFGFFAEMEDQAARVINVPMLETCNEHEARDA